MESRIRTQSTQIEQLKMAIQAKKDEIELATNPVLLFVNNL